MIHSVLMYGCVHGVYIGKASVCRRFLVIDICVMSLGLEGMTVWTMLRLEIEYSVLFQRTLDQGQSRLVYFIGRVTCFPYPVSCSLTELEEAMWTSMDDVTAVDGDMYSERLHR